MGKLKIKKTQTIFIYIYNVPKKPNVRNARTTNNANEESENGPTAITITITIKLCSATDDGN